MTEKEFDEAVIALPNAITLTVLISDENGEGFLRMDKTRGYYIDNGQLLCHNDLGMRCEILLETIQEVF